MKKFLATILIVNGLIWFGITSIAKADDYNTAVIGHIITQKIQGNNVDTSVLEAEIHKLTYKFALEMTSVLEKHLPNILEGIAKEIRDKSDLAYKCGLLENSKIKDKDCT
jgi:hypothetical protein